MLRRKLICCLAAVAVATAGHDAAAQSLDQPVRIIFPFAPGGSGDALGRMMADALRPVANRPVIVENRTGAAGRIGVQAVKNGPPDGSMLLLTPVAPISIYPHFYPELGYDPFKDLEPVSQQCTFDFAVAAAKRTGAQSLKDLVAWMKANSNEQSFASPGAGTLPFFIGLKFSELAGLKLRHVSYKGSAAAVQDLVGGQIPMVITNTADFAAQHEAGTIRVLASTDDKPLLPGVPSFKRAGYDFSGNGWYAIYAPARTPAAILDSYSKALAEEVRKPAVRERIVKMGLTPTGTTRQELARIQKADYELWGPVIKASGFKPVQ